jgi:hypothetical protein
VSIGRRFIVRSRSASERNDLLTRDGGFADWELDIPHLHGVFAKARGWQVDGWNEAGKDQRCSRAAANSAEAPSVPGTPYGATWEGFRYWSGNTLYVPGIGDQEMLVVDAAANPHQPTDGTQYRWVTSGSGNFSCLPATANGVPGDAFLALAPDGTRYRFDWFAHRHAPVVTRATGSPMADALVPANPATTTLAREEVWISHARRGSLRQRRYLHVRPATSVAPAINRRERRSQADAWLQRRADRDGLRRNAHLALRLRQRADRASCCRTNRAGRSTFAQLRNAYTKPGNAATKRCSEQAASSQQDTYTGTLTHPSGAKGEFAFRSQMHGRSYVPKVCPPDHGGSGEGFQAFHPFYFETVGILSKTISGPALDAPMRWTHAFGPVHRSWTEACPDATCPSTKVLEVTGPGEYRRYTFGNRFRESDGKLLKVETGSSPADILRTEVSTYQLDPAGQAYPSRIGRSPYERGDQAGTRIEPLARRVTTQQGRDFTWQVDAACGSGTQCVSTPSAGRRAPRPPRGRSRARTS